MAKRWAVNCRDRPGGMEARRVLEEGRPDLVAISGRKWQPRTKGKVRGIVWRDGGWWYNRTFKGIRRWFNLETKDLSQAIERKQELLDSPSLARHGSLEVDCARFVSWKLARREYTSGSADKARHVLKVFSSRFGFDAGLRRSEIVEARVSWFDLRNYRMARR